VGKPKGKRQLGRPGLRFEDNIKMDFKEVVLEGMDCIFLVQGGNRLQALVNAVMKVRVP
jgi:hypothetical protein